MVSVAVVVSRIFLEEEEWVVHKGHEVGVVILVRKSRHDLFQSSGILCVFIQVRKPLSVMKRSVWKKPQQQRKFEEPIS